MQKKRGQISLFITLGVILFFILAVFLFPKSEVKMDSISQDEAEQFKLFYRACSQKITNDAIYQMGFRGGYLIEPIFVEDLLIEDIYVPYFYYDNVTLVPNTDLIEKTQLDDYISYKLKDCVENSLHKFPYTVQNYIPNVNSKIEDNLITIQIKHDTFLIRYESSKEANDNIQLTSQIRIGKMLNISDKIASDLINDDIDLDYISSLYSDGFNVTFFPYLSNMEILANPNASQDIVFKIIDEKSNLFNKPYYFMFTTRIE